MLGRFGEARALQRHDALIALAGRRQVEGDGEEALAEQAEQARIVADLGEPFGIIFGIAAHRAALVVDDEQRDDALLGLCLQRQLTILVLERGAQEARQHQRLRHEPLDHRRIAVRREHFVEHRPQPHQPAADMAGGDGKAEDGVHCRRGGGHGSGIGHRA